ncbi:hypothetical protein [Chryseobacterium sp. SIMBA_038]|uniref:hypothetical protein n=1 Tax=Chryseobacterium sp. SIMBA_038 TaxID=3085780 RepID=UPI00397823E8
MSLKKFELDIRDTISSLINLINDYCWNKISPNYSFILSDIVDIKDCNRKEKKIINDEKIPVNFKHALEFLEKEHSDLHDINFYVFKVKKGRTVIEIQYYRKSNLDKAFFEMVKNNLPMLHAKISMPIYAKNGKRFDANWESEGLIHQWKTFMYNFKNRKFIRD